MILGIGSDLIDIRRIQRALDRFDDRFTSRCFTKFERNKCDGRLLRPACYAKRYAAKEACSKALGTGFRKGVFWRDIGVVNLSGGKPSIKLTGGALERLWEITPVEMDARIDLTITDEQTMASATVIISALPQTNS